MMNLSDAIRTGAKMRPASELGWVDTGPDGEARTCALMAAAEGAGLMFYADRRFHARSPLVRIPSGTVDRRTGLVALEDKKTLPLPSEWSRVINHVLLPPCACAPLGGADSVETIIWHLHDLHRWSREAVAEWIGTIEDKLEKWDEEGRKILERITAKECDAALKK